MKTLLRFLDIFGPVALVIAIILLQYQINKLKSIIIDILKVLRK